MSAEGSDEPRLKRERDEWKHRADAAEKQLGEARKAIEKVAPSVGHLQKGKTHAFPGFPETDPDCPQCQLEAVLPGTPEKRADTLKCLSCGYTGTDRVHKTPSRTCVADARPVE